MLGWLSLAYGLDGLGYLVGRSAQILDYGGWAGIVSSLIAFYVAIAMVVNGEARHAVLPLGHALAQATSSPPPAPVTPVERRERIHGDQM